MPQRDIFRKDAMDRLLAPEQLDRALEVTTPHAWIALLAILALVSVALFWSVHGRLPTRVGGQGILVSRGGLSSVNTAAAGQLTELYVSPGVEVVRDHVVGRLFLPDLNAELRTAEASLQAMLDEDQRLTALSLEESRLRLGAITTQRASVARTIALAQQRQSVLAERARVQRQLVNEGLITELVLQNTRDAVNLAAVEVRQAQGRLAELSVSETQVKQRTLEDASGRQRRIDDARRTVEQIQEKLQLSSVIRSSHAGRVLEIRAAPGSFVAAGSPVVMLETHVQGAATLEAILYLPGADGKRVLPGMAVEISPSTVKREEHGSLRAVVRTVSAFPSTQQAMLANLGNQDLVVSFSRAIDSPIEVRAELIQRRDVPSGYAWTSSLGPPTTIQPGTLCLATITVHERRPISLVVPILREKLGL